MASVVGLEFSRRNIGQVSPAGRRHVDRRLRHRSETGADSIASLIEAEVLPRLILAHRVAELPSFDCIGDIADAEVEAFTARALVDDAATLLNLVDLLLARGIAVDSVLVDLLAPAARLLGTWWEEDRCDFIEVTMGLWRLQEIVRELGSHAPPDTDRHGNGQRRALFASMPGDQHTFGTIMVGEMFQRHGWETDVAIEADISELLDRVGSRHFDLVGLTLSCDCHTARIPSVILAIRSVSRNARVRVMVGGRVFAEDPSLAAQFGADGTAADARDALVIAGGLVDALSRDALTSC